ncbi:MAG: hypothetical protein ACREQW_07185 [Candidatus Binatia bacterium]
MSKDFSGFTDVAARPVLVQKDGAGRKLVPVDLRKKGYTEAWLQQFLRNQPEILPVAEIEPVFHPLVSIGCEVPIETGSIDNLFISQRGYLTIVETKLWRNPEAKREVVAQLLDYSSVLSKWNYDKINRLVLAYTNKNEGGKKSLFEWVESQLGPLQGGREFFEETVTKNLRLGRFLGLIVGGKIQTSVVEMLSYVNRFPALAIDVALVELQPYWIEKQGAWPCSWYRVLSLARRLSSGQSCR